MKKNITAKVISKYFDNVEQRLLKRGDVIRMTLDRFLILSNLKYVKLIKASKL